LMIRPEGNRRIPFIDSRAILSQAIGGQRSLLSKANREMYKQPSTEETRIHTLHDFPIPLSSLLQERPFAGNAPLSKTASKANSKRFLLPSIKANSFQQDEPSSVSATQGRRLKDSNDSRNIKEHKDQIPEIETNQQSTGTASTSSSSSQSKRFRIKSGSLLKKPPKNMNMNTRSAQPSPLKPTSTKNERQFPIEGKSLHSNIKCCELNRMCLNISSQARTKLPLLIIHFEGIIGSCLIQNKDRSKENYYNPKNNFEHLFIRKDVKNELKLLSRSFLIVLIFPVLNSKYKEVIKYFINNKIIFDGAYYKSTDVNKNLSNNGSEYILDYGMITNDFKIKNNNKKAIVLLPLNINPQRIKSEFLKGDDLENQPFFSSHEKSSFLNFFPKIKIMSGNLKIICIPNFLLDDKNEQYINLYKTEFGPIAKMVQEVIKDNILVESPAKTALNSRECFTEIEIQGVKTEGENISRNNYGIKLRKLDLQGIILQIEKSRDFENKLKQIQKLKLDNNYESRIPTSNNLNNVVDSTQLIQKIVEEIKNKKRSKPCRNESRERTS